MAASLVAVALFLSAQRSESATTYTGLANTTQVLIDSTSSTNLLVNFPYWPVKVSSATSSTNFTRLDISDANIKEVALEFTCFSTNAASTSNAVWWVYKSVDETAPTNAVGTSLQYELLGRVTNVLSGATRVTSIGIFTDTPNATSFNNQSAHTGIGGCASIFVGYVDVPDALSGITNYQVKARLGY